jgi:hypothetical protein
MILPPENRIAALRETTRGQEAGCEMQEQALDRFEDIENDFQ